MSSFKEAGKFEPATLKIPSSLAESGGISLENWVSIKHPNFRLRKPDQGNTRQEISSTDIVPIRLENKPIRSSTLPQPESVSMGIEMEFDVFDTDGRPASLYGNGSITEIKDGAENHIEVSHGTLPWALDEIPGLTPEGLAFQGEIATAPQTTFSSLKADLVGTLKPIVEAFRTRNWVLQPTGLSGLNLDKTPTNISPHEYIKDIHFFGLRGTAFDFDANTVQSHVDLRPFGNSIELALLVGNKYNAVLSTMLNALSLSAPFWKGEPNRLLSHRELSRNQIFTEGGVQDNIPLNAQDFLVRGHSRVANGEIPVPERAGGGKSNGSHNDFRPKLSTGTAEFGSSDSNPNIELWCAQTTVLKHFCEKVVESVHSGSGNLPDFLEMDTYTTRRSNRMAAAEFGPDAEIATKAGKMSIRQAWQLFFEWAKPKYPSQDWDISIDVIRRSLAPSANSVEDYFNPNSPNYLHGIFASAMIAEFRQHSGPTEDIIKQVNMVTSQGFMRLVENI